MTLWFKSEKEMKYYFKVDKEEVPYNKYNNKKVISDGIRFDSILEKNHFHTLLTRKKAGDIKGFLRQISLHLPAGIIYRADFLVFENNGDICVDECKGVETNDFKIKWKQAKFCYPWIKFRLVKRSTASYNTPEEINGNY